MVTKEQVVAARHGDEFHFTGRSACGKTVGPRGGEKVTVTRCRVSGSAQTWKTRPTEFRLPVKYGLYESGEITHRNAGEWHRAQDCPLERDRRWPRGLIERGVE
jgi:hypothetical protein